MTANLSPAPLSGTDLPQTVLDRMASLVIDSVHSFESRRAYDRSLRDFLSWYGSEGRPALSKATVNAYVQHLLDRKLAPATINQHLTVIRRFVEEAADNGLVPEHLAAGIRKVKGVKRQGRRVGQWLTRAQAQRLINAPGSDTLKGKRDTALLGLLVGAGLRRDEVARLEVEQIQQRDGRWAIIDIEGKHNRIRSVPIPSWAKAAIDLWLDGAGISDGKVFRALRRGGQTVYGDEITAQAVWYNVKLHSDALGLKVSPHDLRRTHAKLAHQGGAALEQIQLTLGHASITTTERYLGIEQDFTDAPCDHLRLGGSRG